jgi:predicted XRE-type DNA-binding protein
MRNKSNRMNNETIKKIKELLKEDKYYQHQIAAIVGVNQGRVSEVLHGHWG